MATSKKADLVSEKMKITSGDSYITSFYRVFATALESFFEPKAQEIETGTRSIFTQTFPSPQLSNGQIDALVNNSNPFPYRGDTIAVYSNPYAFWFLSNTTDNELVNILTLGLSLDNEPSDSLKNEIASAAGFGTNYDAAIKRIRDHQFSCKFSYDGYGAGLTELDFSLSLDPSTIGAVLGLVIFVDNNNISKEDSNVVSNLIKSYSNVTLLVVGNSYTSTNQISARSNNKIFEDKFSQAVDRYLIQEKKNESIRHGERNTPAEEEIRPGLTDENFIIRNEDDLIDPSAVGPRTITLNQFTEPKDFEAARSILDVIRGNTTDDEIIESGVEQDITIDGNIEEQLKITEEFGTIVTEETDNQNFQEVLEIMKDSPVEILESVRQIELKITELDGKSEELVAQKNSILKTDEFLLTAMVCVSAPAGDSNKSKGELTVETLATYYEELVLSLANDDALSDQSNSSASKAQTADWKTVETYNQDFLKRLGIVNRTAAVRISKETINKVYEVTKNNPPPTFNRSVSLVNKGNTPNANKKIRSIIQGVISKVRSTETQIASVNNSRKVLQEDLEKYQQIQ